MIAMLLGGLWHGAGWTFVLWGALHGLMLASNHAWHYLRHRIGLAARNDPACCPYRRVGVLTFVAVTSAWVLFRASSLGSAGTILSAMYGMSGPRRDRPRGGLLVDPMAARSTSSDGRNPALFGCCWSARLHLSCPIRINFFRISGRRSWNAHSRTPRPGRGCAGSPTRGGPYACR